jgi:hypothetical protein
MAWTLARSGWGRPFETVLEPRADALLRHASSGARGFLFYGNLIPSVDTPLIVAIDNLSQPVSIAV